MGVSGARRRVLVVDDDDGVRQFLSRILAASGYAVDSARNGEEALERIRADHPDLVVLDITMPVLDGWGVLHRLRGLAERPRVIVLSAVADCRRAVQEGATGCLPKPFHLKQLLDACDRALTARGRSV
jgi:two-component system response regulator MprA